MFKIVILKSANEDIINNYEWLNINVRSDIAKNFVQEIILKIDSLKVNTVQYRIVYKDFRRIILSNYKYSIFYKSDEETLTHTIFAIIAHKQNYKNKLDNI